MWLTKHNTCPYCRKELPTEDEEYEIERRRREAREVGGGGGSSFYG
jgi:E3 ubiquitin-protein ligase RNF115/126